MSDNTEVVAIEKLAQETIEEISLIDNNGKGWSNEITNAFSEKEIGNLYIKIDEYNKKIKELTL
jgi:hypothetical protein|tara:strand:+ start:68 stop:259 length:192 start_codon:yes stop_codon:yes gene_type:complete